MQCKRIPVRKIDQELKRVLISGQSCRYTLLESLAMKISYHISQEGESAGSEYPVQLTDISRSILSTIETKSE